MTRSIKIFLHGNKYASLYYYKENSVLGQLVSQIRAHLIEKTSVDNVPSYALFDVLKQKLDKLYLGRIETSGYVINHFKEGFSFIFENRYLDDVIAALKEMETDKEESHNFVSSRMKDKAET